MGGGDREEGEGGEGRGEWRGGRNGEGIRRNHSVSFMRILNYMLVHMCDCWYSIACSSMKAGLTAYLARKYGHHPFFLPNSFKSFCRKEENCQNNFTATQERHMEDW